ncbi:hypothetical protein ZWY2020_009880 [Hordeum vulgare]|nr:hypothetical protein ZWY2020_009880 [Hordeum vulgare]
MSKPPKPVVQGKGHIIQKNKSSSKAGMKDVTANTLPLQQRQGEGRRRRREARIRRRRVSGALAVRIRLTPSEAADKRDGGLAVVQVAVASVAAFRGEDNRRSGWTVPPFPAESGDLRSVEPSHGRGHGSMGQLLKKREREMGRCSHGAGLSGDRVVFEAMRVLFRHLWEQLMLTEEKVKESHYQITPWQNELPTKTSLPAQSPNNPLRKVPNKSSLDIVPQTPYPQVQSPISSPSPVQARGN